MMRPANLKTRIFLDGANPEETKATIEVLGFLDGQTTNPTLISKNPGVKERLEGGAKFSEGQIIDYYRNVVKTISAMIPKGSISVEVYADATTRSDAMLTQGREMYGWIPNAHIKFPTSGQGLQAASVAIKEEMRVNMTLCFTQTQPAAVYGATKGARKGQVFVSPFIGRLDDKGENGMDLIANTLCMYAQGDGHVEVLTASVRTMDHFLYAIKLGSPIITAPFSVLKEWGQKGLPMPGPDYVYDSRGLASIAYEEIDLSKDWHEYNIRHELTDKGMEQFSRDWNNLIE
jgi:transaldolase